MGPFLPGPGPLAPAPHSNALSSGPTTYNQAVSGALSFTGSAPVFAMSRSLAGSLSFTGAAPLFAMQRKVTGALSFTGSAPLTSMQRLLTATITPTGLLTRTLTLFRTLTASITPSGSLSRIATRFRTLTGALTFSGAAPLASVTRRVTGAITTTGALIRSTSHKIPAGSFTPTGSLTSSRAFLRTITASLSFSGARSAIKSGVIPVLLQAGLTFIGGAQLYPDPLLFPADNEFPFGGAILFQLNRTLAAALASSGALGTHAAVSRIFTAVLQPHVIFFKTSARVFLSASFSSASLIGVRASHTVAQALFASLRNAGSLSTGINPSFIPPGGGGYGIPMPDSFFQRYQPTLRRQKMRV